MDDALKQWSGAPTEIGFGDRPGIVVVDFQLGFTRDPEFLMDGAPLIDRAVRNSARLLAVARPLGIPVATCYTAYQSARDMPYWKVSKMAELLIHGHPATKLDPAIYDPDYDFAVPVATCYTAYQSARDMPYWKVSKMAELLIHGHPATKLDPAIYDPDYDFAVCKTGASIFFQTPVVSYFVKQRVDTVIVTGCVTSACIRASIIDSFQYKFRTIVPEDCVGDREADSHANNLRDVGRRYCDVVTCDQVIARLEERARGNV